MPLRPPIHQSGHADKVRGTAAQRGYDYTWRKKGGLRELFLRAHPVCVHCLRTGRSVIATVVDHIIPHRGNRRMFRDESNWQALCETCHNRKTAGGA